MCGLETVALTIRHKAELGVTEETTRMDKIRNEHIIGTAQVEWFRDRIREASIDMGQRERAQRKFMM